MKLFPTNLFSSGQNQTSSSQSRSKDSQAFASLMQEESPDLSRQVSNDSSMGRAEEAREVNSRPDQAASKSRRKAEDRDPKSEAQSRDTREVDSQESVRGQGAQDSETSSDNPQASAQQQNPAEAQTSSSGENSAAPVAAESSDSEAVPGLVMVEEMSEELIPLPILQAAVQAPVNGKPIPESNPLVGATLLSPAALGGIEGLEIAGTSTGTEAIVDVPVLGENLVNLGHTLTQMKGTEGQTLSPTISEVLPQATVPNPLLQAAQAVSQQGLSPNGTSATLVDTPIQANPSLAATEALPSASQTAQSMLGGKAFQELLQRGQGQQGLQLNRSEGPLLSKESNGEGLSLQELPEAFQEAKSIWTRVDARPTTLQQTTETLSHIPSDEGSDSAEAESNVLPGSVKGTRPLTTQGTRPTQTTNLTATTPTQTVADIAQDQSLESRIQFRTTAQNVMMREVAPTPEGHVPALTEVMVEIDDELRVGVRTNGSEVAVSLDGTTRAVEEMRHIGPELQESLENLGFTLSEFSANDDDAEFELEGQSESSKKDSNDDSAARSSAPKARTVRHGMRVDTTA